MPAGQRLPEEDADRPDVGRSVRLSPGEALGCDVGERAGHVAGGGERLGLLELREAEVEEAHRKLFAVLDHDVSGLHVPVENLFRMCVGERVEDLGADLDRGGVVELAASEALPERLPGDVLIGDVDVVVVALERECAQAARVAKPGRGLHLPLCPRPGLAFSGDDLERDVACGPFVPYEPDRA